MPGHRKSRSEETDGKMQNTRARSAQRREPKERVTTVLQPKRLVRLHQHSTAGLQHGGMEPKRVGLEVLVFQAVERQKKQEA